MEAGTKCRIDKLLLSTGCRALAAGRQPLAG